jgi:subtilisin family serine protease
MTFHTPIYTVESEYNPVSTRAIQRFIPKGISSSSFKRCWDAGYTGKGIIVAILDTGIDGNHKDLKGKVIKSFNLTGQGLSEDHGTHVAGTIAANGWLIGGAPDASLIDIKVLGRNGGSVDTVVKGINLAAANGASVISMSLGGSSFNQRDISKLSVAIQNAWNNGAICVAAAGNNGTSVCTPDSYSYPASVEKAESIGACEVGENLDTISLATFSNENNRVAMAACGKHVVSTVRGGKYLILSGTSMATPHVSAMAAILAQLIRSKYPKLRGANFSANLVSLLHSNALKITNCGAKPVVMIGKKILIEQVTQHACIKEETITNKDITATYNNISFGLGFLRYQPSNGPVIPKGAKVYSNGMFLGHMDNI